MPRVNPISRICPDCPDLSTIVVPVRPAVTELTMLISTTDTGEEMKGKLQNKATMRSQMNSILTEWSPESQRALGEHRVGRNDSCFPIFR